MKWLRVIWLNHTNHPKIDRDNSQLDFSKENHYFSSIFGMVLVKDRNFLLEEYTTIVWMAQMELRVQDLGIYLHFQPNNWDKKTHHLIMVHNNVDNTMTNLTSLRNNIQKRISIHEDKHPKFHKMLQYFLMDRYWI